MSPYLEGQSEGESGVMMRPHVADSDAHRTSETAAAAAAAATAVTKRWKTLRFQSQDQREEMKGKIPQKDRRKREGCRQCGRHWT